MGLALDAQARESQVHGLDGAAVHRGDLLVGEVVTVVGQELVVVGELRDVGGCPPCVLVRRRSFSPRRDGGLGPGAVHDDSWVPAVALATL